MRCESRRRRLRSIPEQRPDRSVGLLLAGEPRVETHPRELGAEAAHALVERRLPIVGAPAIQSTEWQARNSCSNKNYRKLF